MIYNKEYECMSRNNLETLQLSRLQALVERVYKTVPFYRKKMEELNVKPSDIKSLKDITKLPFTTKKDLRDNYPYGLLSANKSDIVRIHASSGTTGKPTIMAYTKNDIEMWSECVARALMSGGIDSNSTVQISYGYGLFTGGLGAHYGSEKLGCATIPMSTGNTKKQIMLMQDLGVDAICCTPSYALYLAEELEKENIDISKLKLKYGIFGAEPWSENTRREIENKLHIKAHDIYGLSEMWGPGVAVECEHNCGSHIQEDFFLPEIIDEQTLEQKPAGEIGELVLTTLTKEGIPLLRYRTRDIASLDYSPCKCGRTTCRMSKVLGRNDDMIIVRGINVFPSQLESVIMSEGNSFENQFLLVVTRMGTLDELEVKVEVKKNIDFNNQTIIENLSKQLFKDLLSTLNLKTKVTLLPFGSLERSQNKSKRVLDLRENI